MQQRRSRMRRTKRGKRLELTARDLALFTVLARYRYLRSTYIHAFVGGASQTRFKERLGDLFHEGYIDRPAKQWEFADARYRPVVYEIDDGARRVLSESGIATDDARTFLTSNAHRQFAHSVMICACLASIELATRGRDDIRFIPWSEILARAPETTQNAAMPFKLPVSPSTSVVPDGLFGLEYRTHGRKNYRFLALEADRGTMPIARSDTSRTSFLGKLTLYRDLIAGHAHKRHLGVSTFLVLTVTANEARRAEMVRKLGERADSPLFLFKAVGDRAFLAPFPGLLGEPWTRTGFSPLRIDGA